MMMTEKNIFNVVEDVKKTLESDKHYIYAETTNKVYDVSSFEITSINSGGEIHIYNKRTDDCFRFKFNMLLTKSDAEKEKRKNFEHNRLYRINYYKKLIEEYKQEIKKLEKDND